MAFPPAHPALERALAAHGYEEPTPVQAAVLEADAIDQDLLVSAQTGSGKTVAFGLAMATTLLGDAERFSAHGAPLALCIAPTRELAMQVSRELAWLYQPTGARIVTCVGGMDARSEQRGLAGGCHIVVGTPGRLRDHLERGHLDLSALRVAVLDEADEMLDLGFREDLEFILDTTPEDRRTLLFSATIAKEIATLARRYQKDAVRIDTTTKNEPHRDIEYRAVRIAPNEIEHAVVNVLRYFESPGALVFCNTREAVRHLQSNLRERGFDVVGLSGELSQRERTDALQALRDRRARVCVATDVAARGLDLPDLGLVIHADLPVNRATMLHRSGRTGRAGKKGASVLMVPYSRRRRAEQMLDSANIEAEWSGPPTADDIRAKDHVRMLEDPSLTEPLAEDELAMARTLLENRTPEQIAAALARILRARMPAPEELFQEDRAGAPQRRERPDRADRADRPERDSSRPDRGAPDDYAWFHVNLGRQKNADPKWLIPLICRLGHVTKADIGLIRIFAHETRFEITRAAEARFTAAAQLTLTDDIKIQPGSSPDTMEREPREARPPRTEFKPRTDYKPRDNEAPRGEYKKPEYKKSEYKPRDNDAPRGDFKPRADYKKPDYKPRDNDAPRAADFKPRTEYKPRDAEAPRGDYKKPDYKTKGDFKPKADFKPRDADAPRGAFKPGGAYNPQDDKAGFKKDRKPREAGEYTPRPAAEGEVRTFKPKAPFKPKSDFKAKPAFGKPAFADKKKKGKGKPNG